MCLRLYNSRNKRTIISQANALKALDGVRRAYGWMDLYGTVGFESTGEVIQWQLWWWIKTWVDMGGIWELECELGWGWRNEAWIPKSDYANRNERFVGLIFKEEDEGGREIVTTYVHFFLIFRQCSDLRCERNLGCWQLTAARVAFGIYWGLLSWVSCLQNRSHTKLITTMESDDWRVG